MNPMERCLRIPALVGAGLLLLFGGAALLALFAPDSSRATSGFAPPKGPAAPNDWFFMQRAWPTGRISPAARLAAVEDARRLRAEAALAPGKTAATDWAALGPENIGGRITDVAADPLDANTIYAASASGGVWKSTDGGTNWSSIFDGYGSPSIGALALDPTDANTVYVGTGEANPGGGSVAYGGDGVWKTTDGGATWTNVGLGASRYIGRIVVDPLNASNVFVAAAGNLFSKNSERGVYRSTDAGATWTKVLYVSDSTGCIDLAIDPANPSRIFAAMWERIRKPDTRVYGGVTSGLYRSVDGGATWTKLTSGLPGGATPLGRIGVAVSPSNPATVYAIFADEIGYFLGLYRSTDGGDHWSTRSAGGLGSFYSSYGWWFGRIYVAPTDPADLWADGIYLYRSTDGGNNFFDTGGIMHADHHAQWFSPSNPNLILKGNDGGLYRSADGGGVWDFIGNMPITQFYTIDVDGAEPWKVYGGTQDNGTNRTPVGLPAGWETLFGGDGHYVNIDPNDANTIYLEYQYGNLYKSVDNGVSFSYAMSGISGSDRKNWSTPVVIDPSSAGKAQTTLYYGANRLYRSTNSASSWTAISGDLTNGNPGTNGVTFGTITTIAVAPSDSATVYIGTDDGNVWVTTDHGGTYTPISSGLPVRWISRVAVDRSNGAIAYVTLSGLRDDDPLAHVFRTTNHGGTWSDISGNLPDAPVNDLVVDPADPSVLYVATDVGVYVTADLGASWSALGTAIPVGEVVTDLDIADNGSGPVLYAATYGRSTWSYDLSAATGVTAAAVGSGTSSPSARLSLTLGANAPNPARGETRILFSLGAPGRAVLDVIDVAGRRVKTLVDRSLSPGEHEVVWDGRDEAGRRAPNGVYFYRLVSSGERLSRKMTLLR